MATTTKSNRQYCDNYASIDANIGPWDSIEAYTTWLSSELGIDEPLEGTEILIKSSIGTITKYRYEIVNGTADWKVTGSLPVVIDADSLNTKLSYGIYYLSRNPFGLLTVSWDFNGRIIQHLLASQTPVYVNGVLDSWILGACHLTRYYTNSTWSNWETSIPKKVSELDNDSGYITSNTYNQLVSRVAAIEKQLGIGSDTVTIYTEYGDGSTSAMGTLSGDGSYLVGGLVTVSATPNDGYEFTGWINTATGDIVSLDKDYTFTASVNLVLAGSFSEVEEESVDVDVTVLGKFSVNVTVSDGTNSLATTSAYTGSNGVEGTLSTGEISLVYGVTSFGETVTGWRMNGVDVTSPATLSEDSVITPVVKGNLANLKLKQPWIYNSHTGKWNTNPSDTKHYRTNFFPVANGQTLTLKFPNHANETVKVWTMITTCWGTYQSDYDRKLSFVLDANGVAEYTPDRDGYMILLPAYAASGTETVFSETDLKDIEVNYSDVSAFGVPTFKYDSVIGLGTVATSNRPQSMIYYNGYLVSISDTLSRFVIINVSTGSIAKVYTNSNTDDETHANTAELLPIKYAETDYYPMILTSTNVGSFKVIRIVSTTATNITSIQVICEWGFTNQATVCGTVSGNSLYFRASRDTSYVGDEYAPLGIYKIDLDLTDLSIYVDTEFNLYSMVQGGTAVKLTGKSGNVQDWAIVSREGYDDLVVMETYDGNRLPANYFSLEMFKTDGTAEGTKIVGNIPLERITGLTSGGELDGIAYVGNNTFYAVLVVSSTAYLYKFTIALPEYTSTGNG